MDSTVRFCQHSVAAQDIQAKHSTSVCIAEDDFLATASAARDTGALGRDSVDRIMDMYRDAGAVGVALVARLDGTGYYVVREKSNRSYPAGWAHVLYDGGSGVGEAARNRRKERPQLLCKVT